MIRALTGLTTLSLDINPFFGQQIVAILSVLTQQKSTMKKYLTITQELISLLQKGNAHVSLDDALQSIPSEKLKERPSELPYSIWELAEHIRITQWDIVQFCKDPKHQSHSFRR